MDGLAAIYARLEAKGWPRYCDNPDTCMERAREFLDAADALGLRERRPTVYVGPGTPNYHPRT